MIVDNKCLQMYLGNKKPIGNSMEIYFIPLYLCNNCRVEIQNELLIIKLLFLCYMSIFMRKIAGNQLVSLFFQNHIIKTRELNLKTNRYSKAFFSLIIFHQNVFFPWNDKTNYFSCLSHCVQIFIFFKNVPFSFYSLIKTHYWPCYNYTK